MIVFGSVKMYKYRLQYVFVVVDNLSCRTDTKGYEAKPSG